MNDATTCLLRAIYGSFEPAAGFVVEEIHSRSWASVTFTGARHQLAFRLEGKQAVSAASRFLAGLEAAEFEMKGHILADIGLLTEERHDGFTRIRLEALTVED